MAITDKSLMFLGGDKDSYLDLGSAASYNLDGENWTIEAWIKITERDASGWVLGLVARKPDEISLWVEWRKPGKLVVAVGNKSVGSENSARDNNEEEIIFLVDTWYHFMLDCTDGLFPRLYVNGQTVIEHSKGETPNRQARIMVGGLPARNSGGLTHKGVNGLLVRDLRIWSQSVLNASLLNPFRDQSKTLRSPDDDFLMAYFPLDTERDRNIHFLLRDTPFKNDVVWVPTEDYPMLAMQKGVTACEFSGNNDEVIEINLDDSLGITNQMTIEAWVKLSSSPKPKGPVISHRDGFKGWELFFNEHGITFNISINGEDLGMDGFTLRAFFLSNTWYHIAATFDGKNIHLFVNGKERVNSRRNGNQIFTAESPLYIGGNSERADFQGMVAEVRLWNMALRDTAFQQMMFRDINGNSIPGGILDFQDRPVNTDNLVGYWKLDDTYNEEVLDSSRNGFRGTAKKVFRTLTHLPIVGRRTFDEDERRVNTRKFWEAAPVTDTAAIQSLKERLSAAERERDQAKESVEKFSNKYQALKEEHKIQLSQLTQNEAQGSTLSTIIERANDEIRGARERLEKAGSDYKLGTVNLELMVIPAGEGNKFILPEYKDQIPTGDQLSKLELEFTPKDSGKKPPEEVAVPNVIGLTEVMAQRSLAGAGLAIEVKYEAVPKGDRGTDRVVRQIPQAGEPKNINGTVLIFIGKAS